MHWPGAMYSLAPEAWTLPFVSVNDVVVADSNALEPLPGELDHDPITPDVAADTQANVTKKHDDEHTHMTEANGTKKHDDEHTNVTYVQTKHPKNTVSVPADNPNTDPNDQKPGHTQSQAHSLPPVKDDESKPESPQIPSGSTADPPPTDSSPFDAVSSKPDQSAELEDMLSPPPAVPEEPATQPPGVASPVPQETAPAPSPASVSPSAPSSSTRMVPVNFKVPAGTKACVASGKLQRIEGAVNVDPPSVGFGEVAPNNWQSNAAALRLTNSGTTQQTITHISCSPLDLMKDATIPYFVIQFGEGGNAPRVKYVLDGNMTQNEH